MRVVMILLLAMSWRCCAGEVSPTPKFHGMCDASGAVALDENLFVVADDEDNKLRIFNAAKGGSPVKVFDLSRFLGADPKEPEVDLEGAARIGDRIYWITSHGRNRFAKYRESRLRFFATTIVRTTNGYDLRPAGQYYSQLLNDLLADPRLAEFRLAHAAQFAPKAPGALNIEGLTATPDGKLIIGFRNPIPGGRALLVPLLNPQEAIAGKPMRLGDPMLLDLGGRGIRSIGGYGKEFVIIGGAFDKSANAKLFLWDGKSERPAAIDADVTYLNPEALVTYPNRSEFLIISDDGSRKIHGFECKELPARDRRFRGAWITP